MKNGIEIEVSFLAGTEFNSSVEAARDFAKKLDVAFVKYDFNGISVAISQVADIEDARRQYDARSKYGVVA